MEAKELMIGDYARMRRIDVEDASWYTYKVLCLQKDSFLEYDPIPLTEEILKANGFKNNENKLSYYVEDGDWLFTIHKIDCMLAISLADDYAVLNYVHELQHALRLCGLNDLADNFKLE